jgi:hypothetical protein
MSNSLLLVALLLLAVVEPFVRGQTFGHTVFVIMISVVLITAVWAASRSRGLLVVSLSLAAPAFVAAWMHHFARTRFPGAAFLVFGAIFLGFTAVVVLRHALASATVTADTIAGAICFYLLLGVIWALIFSLIELAHPGSFLEGGRPLSAAGAEEHQALVPALLYLSLVTLSTVGYGDILPVTPPARMFAALEGVIGPLYLAVLIAGLVGIHASRSGRGT